MAMQAIAIGTALAVARTLNASRASFLRTEAHTIRIGIGDFVDPSISRDQAVALQPSREGTPRRLERLVILRSRPTAARWKGERHQIIRAESREAPRDTSSFAPTAGAATPPIATGLKRHASLAMVEGASWRLAPMRLCG